jgi:hypothetical protein
MTDLDSTTALICAVLRGEAPAWPGGVSPDEASRFLAAARFHGVAPLLSEAFRDAAAFGSWPADVIAACRQRALDGAAYELSHRVEIARVLEALATADAGALVLKGGALAYTHYPNPTLRPRADTDLLIRPDRRRETDAALNELGYTKSIANDGDLISHQANWSRTDRFGAEHYLDVHWRINNSPILAKTLSYEELAERSVAIPGLAPRAIGLGSVDSLLFACIHLAGHANAPYYIDGVPHAAGDRLIWLYDIHLLVSAMSPGELEVFVAMARARAVKAISLEAWGTAGARLGTVVPQDVLIEFTTSGPAEASKRYLSGGHAQQMLGDFLALDNWRARSRWLTQQVLPSAEYMHVKYRESATTWLPLLYVRRGIAAIWRVLSRTRAG